MTSSDDFTIDCKTCIGVGTTACNGCIVMHLLANDDGPIDYVPVRLIEVPLEPDEPDAIDVVVALFAQAGLLDETAQFVPLDEFESYGVAVGV